MKCSVLGPERLLGRFVVSRDGVGEVWSGGLGGRKSVAEVKKGVDRVQVQVSPGPSSRKRVPQMRFLDPHQQWPSQIVGAATAATTGHVPHHVM